MGRAAQLKLVIHRESRIGPMTASELEAVPKPPPDESAIWRYMDFTKFVALLETRSLFFPRVAMLEDPFEGSFPQGQTMLERVRGMLPPGAIPPGAVVNFSPEMERAWVTMREWTFVSCWHVAPYESAAMWKLYASNGQAVAIQSTVGHLREALGKPPAKDVATGGSDEFHIGSIEYIDYSTGRIPSTSFASQFFRKRRSFEHERELRALLMRYPMVNQQVDYSAHPSEPGTNIPVDLEKLLQSVRIAPQAPPWYVELVGKTCIRFKLNLDPSQSELDAVPLY